MRLGLPDGFGLWNKYANFKVKTPALSEGISAIFCAATPVDVDDSDWARKAVAVVAPPNLRDSKDALSLRQKTRVSSIGMEHPNAWKDLAIRFVGVSRARRVKAETALEIGVCPYAARLAHPPVALYA